MTIERRDFIRVVLATSAGMSVPVACQLILGFPPIYLVASLVICLAASLLGRYQAIRESEARSRTRP